MCCAEDFSDAPSALSTTVSRAGSALGRLMSAIARAHPGIDRQAEQHLRHAVSQLSRSTPAVRGMLAVVALQHADGWWNLTPEFAAALACDLAIIEATCPGVASSVR